MKRFVAAMAELLFATSAAGFNDDIASSGDCSPIITGDVHGWVRIEGCGGIPAAALARLEENLNRLVEENYRSQSNLNDLTEHLRDDVAEWEQRYKEAIAQNAQDLAQHPLDPMLEAEKVALQVGDLLLAAEHRDAYCRKRRDQQTTELAREAYTAGERWETAFRSAKALQRYREAVTFKPDFYDAWVRIARLARRLGDLDQALLEVERMRDGTDPVTEVAWLALVLVEEGDIRRLLGQTEASLSLFNERC